MEIGELFLQGKGYACISPVGSKELPWFPLPKIRPKGAPGLQNGDKSTRTPGGRHSTTGHGGSKDLQEAPSSAASPLWSPHLGTNKNTYYSSWKFGLSTGNASESWIHSPGNAQSFGLYLPLLELWLIKFTYPDQIRSVAQSCTTLCDPINRSTPGLPVHHQLPEFTQTHSHRVSDATQPSHPLSSPSPPAPNPSQQQSLFQWVNSSHEVAKVLEFQL